MREINEPGNKVKGRKRRRWSQRCISNGGEIENRKEKKKHIFPSRLRIHRGKERTATSSMRRRTNNKQKRWQEWVEMRFSLVKTAKKERYGWNLLRVSWDKIESDQLLITLVPRRLKRKGMLRSQSPLSPLSKSHEKCPSFIHSTFSMTFRCYGTTSAQSKTCVWMNATSHSVCNCGDRSEPKKQKGFKSSLCFIDML